MDVASMYCDVLSAIKVCGVEEGSRAGAVLTIPEPFTVTVRRPWNRVLMDENRNANPFFHVMEAIWMFAGGQDVEWLLQFNKRYAEYAEKDGKVHGAYGFRWRKHFSVDQITEAAELLAKENTTRQVVIGMWDPEVDLGWALNDRPCNTHIYFRCLNGRLEMTVCNRSNDVVWGMTGANAVHMTMLQELVAHGAGLNIGRYHVVTNNAHLYKDTHGYLTKLHNHPQRIPMPPDILLEPQESLEDFLQDCEDFVAGNLDEMRTIWMSTTAVPMYRTYKEEDSPHKIRCTQWRVAATQWLHWNRR